MSFEVKISGVSPFLRRIKDYGPEAIRLVDEELSAGALDMVRIAKRLAPVDEGLLRNSIGADVSKPMKKDFFASVFYAAYVEFGTGSKVKIPSGYQEFAAQYRGRAGRGNIMQFFYQLVQWVRRKGISGTYSVKTRRRTGNMATRAQQDYDAAYAIMLHILKNGVRPQPFFIPAYREVQPKIVKRILKRIKQIK